MKVFWSWQSDRAAKWCRTVVEDALERALAELSEELELDERPEVDHDTKDEPGMAAIADTIFRKIAASAAFVGDVTSAARSEGGRELPNPNVAIELGWAWAKIGHEKIILVANKAFGPKKPEQLPFDVRHRRAVIFYNVPKGADDAAVEDATVALAAELKVALGKSLADWLKALADAPGPEGRSSREGDPSRWFQEGAVLSHQPFHGGGGLERVAVREGSTLYVRIVPERFSSKPPTAAAVNDWRGPDGNGGIQVLGPIGTGDGGVNGDGVLRYALKEKGDPTDSWTAVQWFRDTGELWTLDTFRLDHTTFAPGTLIREAAQFLARGLALMEHLGAAGLVRIEVGGTGLLGTKLPGAFQHEGGDAIIDRVKVTQARRRWDQEAILQLLGEVSESFAEAYGRQGFDADTIRSMVLG